MDFFPNKPLKDEMLDFIGIEDLFSDIPKSYLFRGDIGDRPMSERETMSHIQGILSKNRNITSFKGGGAYDHYVPSHVQAIVGRSEFYTSYTPYQPEISQGILQAIYEYQSLMSRTVNMPIVNASMYDWSTALGEAALMCTRVNHRNEFLIPDTISPMRRAVLRSYTENQGIKLIEYPHIGLTGQCDMEKLSRLAGPRCSGIYVENPSYLGFFEEGVEEMSSIAHRDDSLFVVGVDPLSCGLVKGPGDYAADIVVGEASHLGNAVNFGGPLLGLFAIRDDRKLLRTMPGRVIGLTEDLDGLPSYVMTLQTREQHIRREKATSNICTNESLCAVSCAAYLASLGKRGLEKLAYSLFSNASYAYEKLNELDGYRAPLYDSVHFREFTVEHRSNLIDVEKRLNDNGLSGGIPIDERCSLYCITDKHSKDDIDRLIEVLGAV
ncbi:MAG TPA: aminomethyl-transferring glycine dehydrogenase subunit GcvPA [Candidatus Methanofastidiosa archaeon]|nr:aminomethyl-transferring glycine dehydrogenase subunit GcvPA [Candidatus Methanofastidiosa archaeon]HPR41612.1 aminomethyl-transferring glycine dehydrogenase subunit GcvPA [Candidatus Methanofastidiosa archaeon]